MNSSIFQLIVTSVSENEDCECLERLFTRPVNYSYAEYCRYCDFEEFVVRFGVFSSNRNRPPI